VAPLPVEPPAAGQVPVPVAGPMSMSFPVRTATPQAPQSDFVASDAPSGSDLPAAGHFGTRVTDNEAAAANPFGSGPSHGLFGAAAPGSAPTQPETAQSRHEREELLLRERSAIASEALSELSRLSGYRPQAVENRGQESLARRTPQTTPGTAPVSEPTAPVPHRERSATDVRSMLSGFRAGVERGRADQGRSED
jgi:hypothetical protein